MHLTVDSFLVLLVVAVVNLTPGTAATSFAELNDGMTFHPSKNCPDHDTNGYPCWADRNRRDNRCICMEISNMLVKGYNRRWDFRHLGNKCYCCGP
ncbi:hypothetical protein Ocin01_07646 [Orchesella cincta]|uniref:Uncharacterized protein n=1 Tax=Orchesella cincta TaxID=48709 RepID=A0A1D2N170_ORCCI|nr:hypothetical protein Ocin01_07646 [Orchesella cincta]